MASTIDVEEFAEFEELYGATARDVLAYVRRRSPGNAEDRVADAYAVAWRRRSELPAPELRRAWLFGVARTLLKAEARQLRRDREVACELAARPEALVVDPTGTDRTAAAVAAALARLAPTDREILQLVAWEGLTPAELAVTLGVRPGTARVRLHRARRTLASAPEVRALVEQRSPTITTTT